MAIQRSKNIRPPQYIKDRAESAAVFSKLNVDTRKIPVDPRTLNFQEVGKSIHDKIKTNDDIMELFPDISLASRILVSSIISPNDISETSLVYDSPDIKLPIAIRTEITEYIKDYINTNYNLETKQFDILTEVLFTKGAYIEAIIPEASVDDIIHNNVKTNNLKTNTESLLNSVLNQSRGILGIGTESVNVDLNMVGTNTYDKSTTNNKKQISVTEEDVLVSITDDFSILLGPACVDKLRENAISDKLPNKFGMSREAFDEVDTMFKDLSGVKDQEFVEVPILEDASRQSIGRPLVLKLPTESIIPIHVMNDPSKHIGYFVLLDNDGNPLSVTPTQDMEENYNMFKSGDTNATTQFNLIKKARAGLEGMTKPDISVNELETLYNQIVENMVKSKLEKGMFGKLAMLNDQVDIYHTMFLRALRAQKTRLLFLPKQLVSYFAFEYRENGTGMSLLEKSSVLFSIRAILLFTRMLASLKNSVTTTNVEATLDENDLDPERTISTIISNSVNSRRSTLPLGVTNVDDLTSWAHSVGFSYNIKGAGLPDLEISTSESNTNKVIPDQELTDDINKYIYMSFGLTPQMIDAAYEVDYATTLVSNNLLFAKFVKQKQAIYNPMIEKHVRNILANDSELQQGLKTMIKNNYTNIKTSIKEQIVADSKSYDVDIMEKDVINYIVLKYIKEIKVSLPQPDTTEGDQLGQKLDNYVSMVDTYLNNVLTDEHLPPELVGKMSGMVDLLKRAIKLSLTRKWASDNKVLPEMDQFLTNDIDGNPVYNLLDEYKIYYEKLAGNIETFFKDITKTKEKIDKKLEAYEDMSGGGMDSGYGDDSGGFGDEESSGDDMGSGDGFDMGGDDFGGEDSGSGEDQDEASIDGFDMGGLEELENEEEPKQ